MNTQKRRGRKKTETPHPVDVYAGKRLRELRMIRNISLTKLARQVELSFQQLQKYENAANRMSLSMLSKIAAVLQVEPCYFFEQDNQDTAPVFMLDRLSTQSTLLFQQIPDEALRGRLLSMFRELIELLDKNNKDDK